MGPLTQFRNSKTNKCISLATEFPPFSFYFICIKTNKSELVGIKIKEKNLNHNVYFNYLKLN